MVISGRGDESQPMGIHTRMSLSSRKGCGMLKVVLAIAAFLIAGLSPGHAGAFSPSSQHAHVAAAATQASHRCRRCCGCDGRFERSYYYRSPTYYLHLNRSGVVYYGSPRIYSAHPSVVGYKVLPPQMFYYTYSREPFYDRIW